MACLCISAYGLAYFGYFFSFSLASLFPLPFKRGIKGLVSYFNSARFKEQRDYAAMEEAGWGCCRFGIPPSVTSFSLPLPFLQAQSHRDKEMLGSLSKEYLCLVVSFREWVCCRFHNHC